jgi:hypothetical protein
MKRLMYPLTVYGQYTEYGGVTVPVILGITHHGISIQGARRHGPTFPRQHPCACNGVSDKRLCQVVAKDRSGASDAAVTMCRIDALSTAAMEALSDKGVGAASPTLQSPASSPCQRTNKEDHGDVQSVLFSCPRTSWVC